MPGLIFSIRHDHVCLDVRLDAHNKGRFLITTLMFRV